MSNSQDVHQRCARHREFARANMELAIAEYENAISKMVCDTLQIVSERAQDIVENARKKRKLNEDVKPEEDTKKNKEPKENEYEEQDGSTDDDDEEEEREKGIPLGLVSFGGGHTMIITGRR